MLKYVALLFNAVALLIYQFLFTEGITVTQSVPSSAKTESEFTVELTINKGATMGFAKLQQDLPPGFTAVEDKNNGASFTFSNQSVKFIWMSLPNDKEFKISYKVKVAADAIGDKTITGKFSYVADNIKQSVEIAAATIAVTSGGEASPVAATNPPATETTTPVEPTKAPETAVTTPTETPAIKAETYPLACSRKVPDNATGEFTVEVTVNKGNTSGFAKLVETLPTGFTATAIESQGASFTFADQKVKYVWISLPSQPEFKLSYKVTVGSGISGPQNINGVFSYIENDQTKNSVVQGTGTITITAPAASEPLAATTEPVKTVAEPVKTTAQVSNDNTKALSATTAPSVQSNLLYRVQIMALHNAKTATAIAAYCKISAPVSTEMAEGFTKYTTGSHNEYKSARDAREEIKNKGVVAPFVTAYNTGKRITVQEALMITNQKWYR